MTKPQPSTRRKEKEIDKDTVVAYHEFIQGRIQNELNGVGIGPGRFLCRMALWIFVFGLACMVVGILIVTLRHRHVYLWDWNQQFVGPFFIILFLMCTAFAVFLLNMAKKRTNFYRSDLSFRPIGDYGVAVVHKSKLTFQERAKTELKSGTTPHNVRHPGRADPNDRGNRGGYSKSGYDNRGYRGENGERRDRRDYDRRDPRDRDRRDDRRDRPDGGRRDDRRRDEFDDRRRGEDDRRRFEDDRRRRDENRDRRGDERRRPPTDDEKRRPPPDDDPRREEARRRHEEERRRRYDEDRRRAAARKQAEAEGRDPDEAERGVDIPRTMKITTTVKLSREDDDESEL